MILRRLAEALRRQDWFVVLIEVAVVVLGIFIGLRVDDWNEARKNRSDELRYLAQVHEDLEAMRLEITDEMTTRQERIGVMRTALDAVERCVDSGEAADALRYTFQIYQTANSINVLDATYNEMREAGAIARIPDQDLKRELVYAFGALGAANETMRGYRVSLAVVDDIVWSNVRFSLRTDEHGRLRQLATFDMEDLCGNARLQNAIVEMIDIQQDGYGYLFVIDVGVTSLLERIDAYLARTR